jgi:hypothetical protein
MASFRFRGAGPTLRTEEALLPRFGERAAVTARGREGAGRTPDFLAADCFGAFAMSNPIVRLS